MSGKIRISEIFGPTVQGEGGLIGVPTVFVRTGGCDYRCTWCDTLYAVLPEFRHDWKPHTQEEILGQVEALSGGDPILITLSGGNPASQDLGKLIEEGHKRGHGFAMETQGSVARDWFADLDHLVLSPKGPSSGMDTDWNVLADCITKAANGPELTLKLVIFDEADYAYARDASSRFPELPVVLQVGNHTPPAADGTQENPVDQTGLMEKFRWLVDKIAEDRWFNARVLPQLHVLAWGNERGV